MLKVRVGNEFRQQVSLALWNWFRICLDLLIVPAGAAVCTSLDPHCFFLPSVRRAARRALTCMTMACCCPAASTSSEAWSLYAARWLRKVTTSTPLTQRKTTLTSGGVEQTRTTLMAGKLAFVWLSEIREAEPSPVTVFGCCECFFLFHAEKIPSHACCICY